MSFSKLAQIGLYIVAGISVLVIGFFYFGDNLIDEAAYQAKVDKMNTPDDASAFNFQADMAVGADTTAMESDSTDVSATEDVAGEESTEVEAAEVAPEEPAETVEVEEVQFTFMENMVDKKTDIALGWAYILVFITLIIAVGFSVVQMFSNTKSLIRGLIGLVAVAILIGIAYMLGSDTPIDIIGYDGVDNKDPQVLKMVDTGLIMVYFVLGGIFVSIIYSEIAKYFK
jgi:hypothetical protein